MFSNNLVEDAELTYRLIRNGYRMAFVPLSVVYGEEPVSFDSLLRQRARWNRGFLSLLTHKVEPKDILGNLYWVFPGISYSTFIILAIVAFASIHTLIFGSKPYNLTYIPFSLWLICITLNYGVLILLLIRNFGLMGMRYASLLPLYLIYTQYMFATSIKTFFVKSWHTTKTDHGFNESKNMKSVTYDKSEKISLLVKRADELFKKLTTELQKKLKLLRHKTVFVFLTIAFLVFVKNRGRLTGAISNPTKIDRLKSKMAEVLHMINPRKQKNVSD
jgi:hypothetical protein